MGATKRFLARLWPDEHGISSVEYAMLLAMIAGGIIMSVELLASAVSTEMIDAAVPLDESLIDDLCASDSAWAKTSPKCNK